jgi:hypothetical protein
VPHTDRCAQIDGPVLSQTDLYLLNTELQLHPIMAGASHGFHLMFNLVTGMSPQKYIFVQVNVSQTKVLLAASIPMTGIAISHFLPKTSLQRFPAFKISSSLPSPARGAR